MSREGTLLFGSLLMSLVALVGGALFYMRPDGVTALLILLFCLVVVGADLSGSIGFICRW